MKLTERYFINVKAYKDAAAVNGNDGQSKEDVENNIKAINEAILRSTHTLTY